MIRIIATIAIAALLARPAAAQGGPPPGGPPDGPPGPERAMLEARVRERLAQVVRRQLNLTDEQFTKLQATNRRFDERRRELVDQERELRLAMRDELSAQDPSHQERVDGLLDRMLKIQRQRLDIAESEQKELATFLTPQQRARYLGIEEQMRRRMQQMREEMIERGGRGRLGPPRDREGMGSPPSGAPPDGPRGRRGGAGRPAGLP